VKAGRDLRLFSRSEQDWAFCRLSFEDAGADGDSGDASSEGD
jgi:hypothetical protein